MCHRSTDFHFPALDQQLRHVRETVDPILRDRPLLSSSSYPSTPSTSGRSTPTKQLSPSERPVAASSPSSQQSPTRLLSGSSDGEINVTLRTGEVNAEAIFWCDNTPCLLLVSFHPPSVCSFQVFASLLVGVLFVVVDLLILFLQGISTSLVIATCHRSVFLVKDEYHVSMNIWVAWT